MDNHHETTPHKVDGLAPPESLPSKRTTPHPYPMDPARRTKGKREPTAQPPLAHATREKKEKQENKYLTKGIAKGHHFLGRV